jgi:NhaA family Na+:H+ antiporter
MSLFIAGQAFPEDIDFAAAKIAVFIASILAGAAGAAILWRRPSVHAEGHEETAACSAAAEA